MFKLTIENFQSIKDKTEIEFMEGVNIIIGPSNSGKTAILRALRGLILNYKGKPQKYISHGQDEARVDLELVENTKYTWRKTSSKDTIYEVSNILDDEPTQYKKAGNNNIFDYVPDFPFILRDKTLINTYTEHDGLPFPFNLSDVEMFKVFEELYNVSSSSTIFKFMKKLETQTNSQISSLEDTITRNKNKIEAIINITDSKQNVAEIMEKLKEKIDTIYYESETISKDCDKARKNNKISKAIKAIIEKKQDFSEDLEIINDLKDLAVDYNKANNYSKYLDIDVYIEEFDTNVVDSYKPLSEDYKLLSSLLDENKELNDEEKRLIKEKEEIDKELSSIEVCPLCGNKMENK